MRTRPRGFAKKLKDFDPIREAVASYASRLAEKLRHHKLKTDTVMVSLCTNRFQEENHKYYNSTVIKLPKAVNDNYSLIKASIQGLGTIERYKQGYAFLKSVNRSIAPLPPLYRFKPICDSFRIWLMVHKIKSSCTDVYFLQKFILLGIFRFF